MSEKKIEGKEEVKKSENTEQKSDASAPAAEAKPAEVAAPAPKLAPGLFNGFTLGSTLVQGPRGNVMSNMKKPLMDYEQKYQNSTKNQKMTAEELEQLKNKK